MNIFRFRNCVLRDWSEDGIGQCFRQTNCKDQMSVAIQIAEVYAFRKDRTKLLSGWTGLMYSTTQESQRSSGTLR
jgi:hypothetical protein